jgi:hypothetical protein
MNKSPHKVLIGIPTYEGHAFCRDDFIKNTIALAGSDHDVLVIWNGEGDPSKIFPSNWKTQKIAQSAKERGVDVLVRKHNLMSKRMISGGYSHLFLLESDVFPPANTIERLLAHDKDMVTAVYLLRGEAVTVLDLPDTEVNRARYNGSLAQKALMCVRDETAPAVWGIEDNKVRFWRLEDMMKQRGLVEVAAAGVGAVLIRKAVLKAVPFAPESTGKHADDFPFYHKARWEHNFILYVDTDILCQHRHDYGADGEYEYVQHKWFKAKDLEPEGQTSAEHTFA